MGKNEDISRIFEPWKEREKQTSGEKRQVRLVLTCSRRGAIILPKRGLADRHHHRSRRDRDVTRRTDARGALDMDRVQQAHRRKVYGQRLRRLHRKVSRRQERIDDSRVRIFVPVFVICGISCLSERRRLERRAAHYY